MIWPDWSLAQIQDALGLVVMISGGLGSALVWWLSKTFASKTLVAELASRQDQVEARLAAGESRFVHLDTAIRDACMAARSAKDAADDVAVAAEKLQGAEITMARLQTKVEGLDEKLESIEHFTRLIVQGHMKMGDNS